MSAPPAGPGRGVAMRDALTHRWPEDLMEAGGRLVSSPELIVLPDDRLRFRKGFLARDPGGHALQMVER